MLVVFKGADHRELGHACRVSEHQRTFDWDAA